MYNSKDLTHDQFETNLRKFSLNEEEYEYFKQNDFQFLTFKSSHKKSTRQMLRHINKSGTPEWIDVALYNPFQVTIRSFTNDLNFIPKVAGYTYDEDIGFELGEDILLMSNEMPKLTHQALNFFSSELDEDYFHKQNITLYLFNYLNFLFFNKF